jgi:hypothetical protein
MLVLHPRTRAFEECGAIRRLESARHGAARADATSKISVTCCARARSQTPAGFKETTCLGIPFNPALVHKRRHHHSRHEPMVGRLARLPELAMQRSQNDRSLNVASRAGMDALAFASQASS